MHTQRHFDHREIHYVTTRRLFEHRNGRGRMHTTLFTTLVTTRRLFEHRDGLFELPIVGLIQRTEKVKAKISVSGELRV